MSGFIPTFIPAILLKEQHDLVQSLIANGATSPDTAVMLPEARRFTQGRARHVLAAAGAIVETADGRCYFDEAAYLAQRARLRWRLLALAAVLAGIAIVMTLG